MKFDWVRMPSYWETEVRHKYITHDMDSRKLVVQFPGKNYPCDLPLLYYARSTAIELGYDVLSLEYGYQAAKTELKFEELPVIIEECTEAVRRIIDGYDEVVFIGKSMGTVVAGEVHRKLQLQVKHIFLTPVLETVPFINSTDRMVIYGNEDPLFGDAALQLIAPEYNHGIIEIPGADHGLEVGDVKENLNRLQFIVELYVQFLTSEVA